MGKLLWVASSCIDQTSRLTSARHPSAYQIKNCMQSALFVIQCVYGACSWSKIIMTISWLKQQKKNDLLLLNPRLTWIHELPVPDWSFLSNLSSSEFWGAQLARGGSRFKFGGWQHILWIDPSSSWGLTLLKSWLPFKSLKFTFIVSPAPNYAETGCNA
jgi:hypothetical protein